ncbi:hypothetical protein DSO57_1022260 [Entomophthora muscae]|uniref:Uncharacterized protein n=1 Tax=Entomophthora muscae TaxID=34485 RepID=A0ACC2RHZ0_9FUNG|nr:hypothetical protein DSO57_1022260 [Entomophthora muscae]
MPKIFNNKAHENLEFVIQYLKQSQNPHVAILELDSRFKDRHPTDQEAILINNLFAHTKLAVESKDTQDTPAPPSSPNLKLALNPPMEKINPPEPTQAESSSNQEEPVTPTQATRPEIKESSFNEPMETKENLNLF